MLYDFNPFTATLGGGQLGISNPIFQMKKLRLGNNKCQEWMGAMDQKQVGLGQSSSPALVAAPRGLPLGPTAVIPKPGY